MKALITLCLALLCSSLNAASNIDLATVPARSAVQLTIYNSEDLTLVRERRRLSFKKGINTLQFSWANTAIDPTSVELHFPDNDSQASVRLIDTRFPHKKPQMLYWEVESTTDTAIEVEISYFTSGIHWDASYIAISNAKETQLTLENFVRIRNESGERYENAQIRLVVGEINLVDKIAELARAAKDRYARLKADRESELRRLAAMDMLMDSASFEMQQGISLAAPMELADRRAKKVGKQAISEYFIYTIEGRETIETGWSKRIRSLKAADIPIATHYRYWPERYGPTLERLFVLANTLDANLGKTPLPNGLVSVFRKQKDGSLQFLAERQLKYVPIGDDIELLLGRDPDVILSRSTLKHERQEIWAEYPKPKLRKRIDLPGKPELDHGARVVGWNLNSLYRERIHNGSNRSIHVSIRRRLSGDIGFQSAFKAHLHDYRTVEFETTVAPGQKGDMHYRIIDRLGTNKKQDGVTLMDQPVS